MQQVTQDLMALAGPVFQIVKQVVRQILRAPDPLAAAKLALEITAHEKATDAALDKLGVL